MFVFFLLCLYYLPAVSVSYLYPWFSSGLKNDVSLCSLYPSKHSFSGSANCEEEPDRTSRFWDELSYVGLPQHLNVQSLFESGKSIDSSSVWTSPDPLVANEKGSHECTICLMFFLGQCWAHQSCALWSEGVIQGEGQSLLNVDRAIYSGSTKVSQTRTLVG